MSNPIKVIADAIRQAYPDFQPLVKWGSLSDTDLRAWWDKNNCNSFYVPTQTVVAQPAQPSKPAGCGRAAYVETWRPLQNQQMLQQLDHVCVAFATCDSTGALQMPDEMKAPHPRSFLAFGGWGNCGGFSAALQPAVLPSLVANLKQLCARLGYVGVDIDFEYPSTGDVNNLTALVKSLSGAGLHVSLAVPDTPAQYSANIPQLLPFVDVWHVMTYDYVGPWVSTAGYNSDVMDGTASMSQWRLLGVPQQKLWLGSAWYGRIAQGASVAPIFGGPCTYIDGGAGEPTYATIANEMENQGDWVKTHPMPGQSVLVSSAEKQMISYEDPMSVREKVSAAIGQHYGGVFCWSWGQDTADAKLAQALLA